MSVGEAPQIGWDAAFSRKHVFLLLGALLGAAFWLLHAIYDYSVAELGSFWDCLTATDPDILALRLATLGIAVATGAGAQYLAAGMLQKQDLRVLFDKANDGLVLLEVETCKIVDCNEKACALLGYPRDELLRRLAYRNARPGLAFHIPEEMMRRWIELFQKPDPDELQRRN